MMVQIIHIHAKEVGVLGGGTGKDICLKKHVRPGRIQTVCMVVMVLLLLKILGYLACFVSLQLLNPFAQH